MISLPLLIDPIPINTGIPKIIGDIALITLLPFLYQSMSNNKRSGCNRVAFICIGTGVSGLQRVRDAEERGRAAPAAGLFTLLNELIYSPQSCQCSIPRLSRVFSSQSLNRGVAWVCSLALLRDKYSPIRDNNLTLISMGIPMNNRMIMECEYGAYQLHYVLAIAESNAVDLHSVFNDYGGTICDMLCKQNSDNIPRTSSRLSIPEFIYPDIIQYRVTERDCPVCQLMFPKDRNCCVSRLVILHEEAEDGNAMPDLTRPVGLVSRAVDNLIKYRVRLKRVLLEYFYSISKILELTHQVHREILVRCIDAIRTLSPILICSMKIFIQISLDSSQRGQVEAAENRNYLAQRMTDEMNEIIRVLQLTTYDEDEWDADNVTVMRKALSAAKSLLTAALDWLGDAKAQPGAIGEKAIRRILDYADRIASRALPEDSYSIKRSISEISSLTDSICELRNQGRYDNEGLAANCAQKLKELVGTKHSSGLLPEALGNAQRHGGAHPAHTAGGRLEQALRWLENPGVDDGGLGRQAIRMMTDDARKLADKLNSQDRNRLLGLCSDIDGISNQLADLERRGLGNTPEAHALRQQLKDKLRELADFMKRILTDRVVEDFADISTPLKQFVEAVHADPHMPNREPNFHDKASRLRDHSDSMTTTARLVATCGPCKNKNTVEAIIDTAEKVFIYFNSSIIIFILKFLNNLNFFIVVYRNRLYNYIAIPPMVNHAKQVAFNPRDGGAISNWRGANDHLLDSVRVVGEAISGVSTNGRHSVYQDSISRSSPYQQQNSTQLLRSVAPQAPTPPVIHNKMLIREEIPAPPRPPPPVEISPPPRPPPPPEYDEEEETRAFWERYPLPQASHQPILSAAHNLHNELKQWSSQENEIVAAAKRMAILMARLSQLVRGEGGNKKDLIDCAKAIADSSEEVTRLAVQLARLCTDIKMRMAMTVGPYGQPVDGKS
uniref:Vinculin n=1 Tax=Heterorhabditis bacteriophora TaxID=37862 RepID=A0A1I7WB35_HETBA